MGWKRFLRDNFTQSGVPLSVDLQRYPGKLRFTVQIFDISACEAHLKPSYCSSFPVGDNGGSSYKYKALIVSDQDPV